MLHLFYVLLWYLPSALQSEIDVTHAVRTVWPKLYYMKGREKAGRNRGPNLRNLCRPQGKACHPARTKGGK